MRRIFAIFLTLSMLFSAFTTPALANDVSENADGYASKLLAETQYKEEFGNIPTLVSDTVDEKIMEKWKGATLFRSVYNKKEGVCTIYQIEKGNIVAVDVISDEAVARISSELASRPSTRAIYPVESQSGFGYFLATPNNGYCCSELFAANMNLSKRSFEIGEQVLADSQAEMRAAVDDLIGYEGELEIYTNASTFINILAAVLLVNLNIEESFEMLISNYNLTVEARVAAMHVNRCFDIAASRYCYLEQYKSW